MLYVCICLLFCTVGIKVYWRIECSSVCEKNNIMYSGYNFFHKAISSIQNRTFNLLEVYNGQKLTIEEGAELIFEYIYKEWGKEYFAMCTIYYADGEGAQDTIYHSTQYPAFEFDYPESHCRVQLYCQSSLVNDKYAYYDFFVWNYTVEGGERVYSHANHATEFAVNRKTGEIILERYTDEDGIWIYNEEYLETFRE